MMTAAGMRAISRMTSGLRLPIPGATWLFAGSAIAGIGIAVIGVVEFRRAGTTVDPRVPGQSAQLVASGVYRYSRNPMYVGFLLVLCGWAVLLGNALSLLLVPAFVVYMNHFQIAPEERAMREKFGAAYTQYADTVRRWL
jgi:protein-S-isoprenylcysteine O-methyltransferase Ste14